MSKVVWDKTGERLYKTGIDHVVLYRKDTTGAYNTGVAWNGITAVNESPSGAEANPLWADNIKYLNLVSAEEFAASIEAFMYPDEFAECDGSVEIIPGVTIGQQNRKEFGLSYRNILGNDVDYNDHGYEIHLVWGALAAPSETAHSTVNDSPEVATMSWEVSTTPVEVEGYKPTAHMTLNSTKLGKDKMAAIEAILYGSDDAEPRLPLPGEIIELFGEAAG